MAYRKLGRDNKHRRSMLATLTKQVIMNERIKTTDTRAKEVRKSVDKMITLGKRGDLVSRRSALAFLHNDTEVVDKIFNDLAKRFEKRDGGYTRILKVDERRGDGSRQTGCCCIWQDGRYTQVCRCRRGANDWWSRGASNTQFAVPYE